MPDLRVDIDISGYVAQVDQARSRDIPFVTAKALTRTAQDGQIEMKRRVGQIFKLRNSWTINNIKIVPAQKLSWPIQAEVFTDTANSRTGAPDYLVGQEEGAERVPIGGRQHLAIPTENLYKLIGGRDKPIPDEFRPRALLALADNQGRYVDRRGRNRRSAQSREYYFFEVTFKSGATGIMARHFNDRRDAAVVLYIFVHEGNIRKRLNMQETVQQIAEQRFEQHWDDAWDAING
jgi:hypothetical protein